MAKQNEREESFWTAQEHRCTALLQRSEMADRTSKELVRFFDMTNRAVTRTLAEMSVPVTLGSAETGSLKEACAATEQIRHVVVDHLTELRDKQLQHCLAHATTLSKVMAERVQAANQVVTTASKDLKREREQLKEQWAQYDKAVQERVKSEFSERSIRIDPLLPLRSLLPPPSSHHHSSSSHPAPPSTAVLQNQYRQHLSALFLDLKTEEERRIEQSKAFLLQVLMSMNTVIETIHTRVREGIVAVTSIDAVDDLHHFIESNDLALAESEMEAFRATRKLSAAAAEPQRKLSAQPPAEAPRKASTGAAAEAAPAAQTVAETSSVASTTTESVVSSATPSPASDGASTTETSVSITTTPPATDSPSASSTSSTTAADTTHTPASTSNAASPATIITASTPAQTVTPAPVQPSSTTATTTPASGTLTPPTTTVSAGPIALLPTPTVFSLQPPTRDTSLLHRMYALEVEREGILHRPASTSKSNITDTHTHTRCHNDHRRTAPLHLSNHFVCPLLSAAVRWKEQWVVVSKSGWLHCWDDRSESAPTVSMALVDVVAQLEKNGGGGIEIVSVAGSGSGSGGGGGGSSGGGKKDGGGVVAQVFRAENPMEAARWIEAINKYCHPA